MDTHEDSHQMKGIAWMNAVERMNSLEGIEETALSPPLNKGSSRRRTGENWEGRNRTDQSRRRAHDEEPKVTQLINMPTRSRDIISSTTRWKCSLIRRSGTCSMGQVGGSLSSSTILEKLRSFCSLRRFHEKVRSLCSLRRLPLALLSVIIMGPIRHLQ